MSVSDKSPLTAAHGLVVDDLTLGCRSTGPGTRVTALLSGTGEEVFPHSVLSLLTATSEIINYYHLLSPPFKKSGLAQTSAEAN